MATQTSSSKNSIAAGSSSSQSARPLAGRLVWHSSAPSTVSKAGDWMDESKGWEAWLEYLSRRSSPEPLATMLPGQGSSLAWCGEEFGGSSVLDERLDVLDRLARGKSISAARLDAAIDDFLARHEEAAVEPLEYVAWSHALVSLAQHTRAETWWNLLGRLLDTCCDADQIDFNDSPMEHQWLAGELRLAMSYNLPEIKTIRRLVTPARRALSQGPDLLLDGEGLPHASRLALMRPLLACWTRCVAMGQSLKNGCWNETAEIQYAWLIRQTLRFSRRDGTQVLTSGARDPWPKDLFQAAMELDGDREDRKIARMVLPARKRSSRAKDQRSTGKKKLPASATHSEWSSVAMLRPTWSHADGMFAVDYSRHQLSIELSLGRHTLLFGSATLNLWADDEPLEQETPWESVCWESDSGGDYLEIEATFSNDVRVQRQMLFGREDRFLLLADAIHSPQPCSLRYEARWPLDSGTVANPRKRTREVTLTAGKPRAEVLPLALPEWRRDLRVGELEAQKDHLLLRQAFTGRGLYAPLLIDLDARRRGRPVTWRQLTIAEDRKIVTPEMAVGYRIQVGKKQWLIYRSIGERGSRSVLGENLISEFLVCRFDANGAGKRLVEIE